MLCPNCKQEQVKDKNLSTTDNDVYVFFIVGRDQKTGKTYCPKCIKDKGKFFCQECGKAYSSQGWLGKHIEQEHG